MKPLLIVNGTVITSSGSCREDIIIECDTILKTGKFAAKDFPGHQLIDATGKYIFPGGVDPHVHLALPTPAGPSCDNFRSGSQAAITGGTTSFIDFVTPKRNQSLIEALRLRREEAQSSLLDYKLHMGISGWNPDSEKEIEYAAEREGITSFKAYLAYRESIGVDLSALQKVMEVVRQSNGIVLVHCEDGEMISRLQKEFISEGKKSPSFHALSRPEEAEIRAVGQVIELSAKTGCRVYIVHTSTGAATDLIRQAKKSGISVYAETCPQYLLLDDSCYFSQTDIRKILPYIISPPIRSKENQDLLWEGVADGTFDTVATDHCPFNLVGQKDKGSADFTKIPNGAGGIEHRLNLLYTYGVLTHRISLQQFVSLTAAKPAELFGFGKKGKIEAGYDADIVIWDPEMTGFITAGTDYQQCDTDIYEGMAVKGKPATVIVKGEVAFNNGKPNQNGLYENFPVS